MFVSLDWVARYLVSLYILAFCLNELNASVHIYSSSVRRQKGLSIHLNSNQLDLFASELTTVLLPNKIRKKQRNLWY